MQFRHAIYNLYIQYTICNLYIQSTIYFIEMIKRIKYIIFTGRDDEQNR